MGGGIAGAVAWFKPLVARGKSKARWHSCWLTKCGCIALLLQTLPHVSSCRLSPPALLQVRNPSDLDSRWGDGTSSGGLGPGCPSEAWVGRRCGSSTTTSGRRCTLSSSSTPPSDPSSHSWASHMRRRSRWADTPSSDKRMTTRRMMIRKESRMMMGAALHDSHAFPVDPVDECATSHHESIICGTGLTACGPH
jgi:hypothetical protein